MKKVFITGENGFISRYLDRILINEGFDIVWGYSNKDDSICNFKSTWNEGKELDITDEIIFNDTVKNTKPDIIIHTAGFVDTVLCKARPKESIISNVFGAYNAAKICNKFDIKMIMFSTTAIYDPNDYDNSIINDNTRIIPQTIYGATKFCGELLSKQLLNNITVIRPCFAYGGIEDGHSGIARIIKSGFTGNNEDILLDPNIKKDYMRVEDLVSAIITLLKLNTTGDYNISVNNPVPFSVVLNKIKDITHLNLKYTLYPEKDYLKGHIVDNSKIKSLGWKPIYSLEEGIKKSFNEISTLMNKC